jgi:hypothetical protein
MNRDKLKIIIKNLELLTQSLKEEVYADTSAYNCSEIPSRIGELDDYDEIFEDDD